MDMRTSRYNYDQNIRLLKHVTTIACIQLGYKRGFSNAFFEAQRSAFDCVDATESERLCVVRLVTHITQPTFFAD